MADFMPGTTSSTGIMLKGPSLATAELFQNLLTSSAMQEPSSQRGGSVQLETHPAVKLPSQARSAMQREMAAGRKEAEMEEGSSGETRTPLVPEQRVVVSRLQH